MADAPKIIQDEFSIRRGGAMFRLVWTDLIDSEDKVDLLDWLKLVERRIRRLPDVGPIPPDVAPSDGKTQEKDAQP